MERRKKREKKVVGRERMGGGKRALRRLVNNPIFNSREKIKKKGEEKREGKRVVSQSQWVG